MGFAPSDDDAGSGSGSPPAGGFCATPASDGSDADPDATAPKRSMEEPAPLPATKRWRSSRLHDDSRQGNSWELDPEIKDSMQWQKPLLDYFHIYRKMMFLGYLLLRPITHEALLCGNLTEHYGFEASDCVARYIGGWRHASTSSCVLLSCMCFFLVASIA